MISNMEMMVHLILLSQDSQISLQNCITEP